MVEILGSMASDKMLPPLSGSCVQLYVSAACTVGAPATAPEKLKARHNKRIIMPVTGEQCRILTVFMPHTSNRYFQQDWWTETRTLEPSTYCIGSRSMEPLHLQLKPGMQHWHTLVQQLPSQNGCS